MDFADIAFKGVLKLYRCPCIRDLLKVSIDVQSMYSRYAESVYRCPCILLEVSSIFLFPCPITEMFLADSRTYKCMEFTDKECSQTL